MITFKVSDEGLLTNVFFDKDEETLRIPESVDGVVINKIHASVFQDNSSLRCVYIPETVREMGLWCFKNCFNLEVVIFEGDSKLQKIGEGCFYNCQKLQNIEGNFSHLCYIATQAFFNCYKLTFLDLRASSIEAVYRTTFANSGIKHLLLPTTVQRIYENAFKCTDVDIDFNDIPQLQMIGSNAFQNSGIVSIDFSKNTSSKILIQKEAFKACSKLSSAVLSEKVILTHSGVFEDCQNLGSVTIETNATCIPESTFNGCSMLSEVNLLNSNVSVIGVSAFQNCTFLKSITIPKTVKRIENCAFKFCDLSNGVDLTAVDDDFEICDDCFGYSYLTVEKIKLDFLNPITVIGNPFSSSCCSLKDFMEQYPFIRVVND